MKTRTNVKGGGTQYQHNECMNVRSNVKAEGASYQHNESMKRNDHLSTGTYKGA